MGKAGERGGGQGGGKMLGPDLSWCPTLALARLGHGRIERRGAEVCQESLAALMKSIKLTYLV